MTALLVALPTGHVLRHFNNVVSLRRPERHSNDLDPVASESRPLREFLVRSSTGAFPVATLAALGKRSAF